MGEATRRRSWVPLAVLACVLVVAAALVAIVVGGGPRGVTAGGDVAPRVPGALTGTGTGTGVHPPRRAAPSITGGAQRGAADGGAAPGDASWMREPLTTESAAVAAEATRRVFSDPLAQSFSTGGSRGSLGIGGRAGGRLASGQRALDGVVLDALTGAPIAGAEIVTLFAEADGFARRYTSSASRDDGTFRAHVTRRGRVRTDVLVRAAGYRPMRVALADAPTEWSLRRAAGTGRGTLRGRAETPEGTPLHGMLLVALKSENGDSFEQYAWCDNGGRFELAGLRPGRHRLSLERARTVEVTVVAGGISPVTLVAARPNAPPPARPRTDRRVVEVTGLADGTPLRADAGRDVFWRTVVRDGVARFELPFGLWVLAVDRPGGDVQAITVHDERGVLRPAFTPDVAGRTSGDGSSGARPADDRD